MRPRKENQGPRPGNPWVGPTNTSRIKRENSGLTRNVGLGNDTVTAPLVSQKNVDISKVVYHWEGISNTDADV